MNFFGTDGIRGRYGVDIDDGIAYNLGKALINSENNEGIVVVGRDTRISGKRLLNALAQGVYDNGGNVVNVGILPTNAVAHFVRKIGADYGVMVSASHNPPCDNGLKVFDNFGVKLCEKKQIRISKLMENKINYVATSVIPEVFVGVGETYVSDLSQAVKVDLHNISVSLDVCYGASYVVATNLFSSLGAKVVTYCGFNRGKEINVNCGATKPQFLLEKLKEKTTDLGFAFDGDADRLAVFEKGKFVDNSNVFYALAKYYQEKGYLSRGAVVGTVLTNFGVEQALLSQGIKLMRSSVGDEKIFQLMSSNGVNLGGEESGHYLLSDYATSSDALLNALMVSKIYVEKGSIIDYTKELTLLPVTKLDLTLSGVQYEKLKILGLNALQETYQKLYPSVRIVLRLSGTENIARIFIEGDTIIAEKICQELKNKLLG